MTELARRCRHTEVVKFDSDDSIYFPFQTDYCGHLKPVSLDSEMLQHNTNLTTWDKPWIPELDWLNSYINLSIYDQNVLDGLAVGYKVNKYTKYMGTSKWGCFLTFHWEAELADAYYFDNFNNTNETMLLMAPLIPMRPDTFKDWSTRYPFFTWMYYRPGDLKDAYIAGEFGYIWRTHGVILRAALAAAALIIIVGVFGEYHS